LENRVARGLTRWFDVRPGEAATLRLLVAFAFSLGLAQVYLASATISLFLGAFPPSMLPFGYIGIALAMPLVGWAHGWLERRFSLPRLVLINLLLMALSLLGWRWLVELPWNGWLLLLYVWWVVVWSVLNLALWSIVGRIFDLRQNKRLSGIVGAGEVAAMILGGLSIAFLVGPIGTASLLLVSVAAIILAILLLGRISSVHRTRLEGADGADEGGAEQGVLVQFKDRYLRLIFINSALAWVVFYVVDNAFFNIASVRFPTEAEMAILVGRLDATIGALLLLSRLFLSARLLAWVGVRGGLLVIPLVIGSGALAVVLAGQLGAPAGLIFALAATVKIFEEVCRDSIFRATLQVLFQPLPPGRRLRAQVTTESMVDPFAAALAAGLLLLLVSGLGFDTVRLYQVLLGLFLIWAVLAWRLQFQYLSSLRRALSRRAAAGSDADVFDGASSEILQQALYSKHPSEIQHAMGALLKIDPALAHSHLPRLLGHSHADVRCMALRWTAAEHQIGSIDEVRRLAWHDARGRVRSEALRTLAALLGDECVEELPRALSDPVAEVRAGATVGLIRHGGIQGILLAGNDLLLQVGSDDPRQRCSAATVVGEIGIGAFYQPLLRLLADSDPQVQQAALQSAARLRNEALWPAVLPTLDRASLRGYAIEALRAGGESAALAVARYYFGPGLDLMQRSRLLRVLGVIDHPQARRSLLELLDEQNRELREQALQALVRQRASAQEADRMLLLERIEAERADAVWLLQQICACRAEGELSILSPLREQLTGCRRRLLLLLQLCLDRGAMAQVRDRIEDPSLERRAYAVELLDNLLRGELRTRVLALFEGTTEAACLASLNEPLAPPLTAQQRRLLIEEGAAAWGCSWLQATTLCALDPTDPVAGSRHRGAHGGAALGGRLAVQRHQPGWPAAAGRAVCPGGRLGAGADRRAARRDGRQPRPDRLRAG
jgi:HEAT repeat protein